MLERIGQAFAGIHEAAPKVATLLGAAAARNVAFLASKAPKSAVPYATLTPQFEKPRLSDSAVASFARTYRAWDKPETVLDDMAKGAITREGIEVLRECYPKLYREAQEQALTQLADLKTPLSYEKRIQLGLMLAIPSDPSLDPSFVATMQQSKKGTTPAAPTAAAPATGARASGRHGRAIPMTGYQTESERIAGT